VVVCGLGETADAIETEVNLSLFFRRQFVTLHDDGRDVASQRRLPSSVVVEHKLAANLPINSLCPLGYVPSVDDGGQAIANVAMHLEELPLVDSYGQGVWPPNGSADQNTVDFRRVSRFTGSWDRTALSETLEERPQS
jgi:hypothetical protein